MVAVGGVQRRVEIVEWRLHGLEASELLRVGVLGRVVLDGLPRGLDLGQRARDADSASVMWLATNLPRSASLVHDVTNAASRPLVVARFLSVTALATSRAERFSRTQAVMLSAARMRAIRKYCSEWRISCQIVSAISAASSRLSWPTLVIADRELNRLVSIAMFQATRSKLALAAPVPDISDLTSKEPIALSAALAFAIRRVA